MASTTDISKALLDLLKGSNQLGTPQGNRSPSQACQEERDDLRLEVYEKERLLSPRELHKWKRTLFSVYVGRLPTDVTVREMIQFFSEVGVPKDVFVIPPEGNKSHTYGFLRYGTLEEARKAVACMNGRILGNRHIVVEISSETRANLNDKEEKEDICGPQDRLIRKEYPTLRRRSLPDNEEEFVQSKLLQSLAKLKSDQVSVVNAAGSKDTEESNGPSFLEKLEKILKKVIKEVPGETTTKSGADEGPVCTMSLEDEHQMNSENRSLMNSDDSPVRPRENSNSFLPKSIGLNNGPNEPLLEHHQEQHVPSQQELLLKQPPAQELQHSPMNSDQSPVRPRENSITFLPKAIDLKNGPTEPLLEHHQEQHVPSQQELLLKQPPAQELQHSPINSDHSPVRPRENSSPFSPKSIDLKNGLTEQLLEHQEQHVPSQQELLLKQPPAQELQHSPINSDHSPVRPRENSSPFSPKSIDLKNGLTEQLLEHQEQHVPSQQELLLKQPPAQELQHSPINSDHSPVIPRENSSNFLPKSIGLKNGPTEPLLEHQEKQVPSQQELLLKQPPVQELQHSPINSDHSPVRPRENSSNFLPKAIDMKNGLTEPLLEHHQEKHVSSQQELLLKQPPAQELQHSPINSDHSPVRPRENSNTFLPKSIGLNDGPIEPLLENQGEQVPSQQELLLKQRSVHELQVKLGIILKENQRLHSALPKSHKDKRTSGMYPDKEMLNLEESIHDYEVRYQREIEMTVARNAEHELLYEREKLSAAFDTILQKELDLELQIEKLKNEIKLADMANQLLAFYQKRIEIQ